MWQLAGDASIILETEMQFCKLLMGLISDVASPGDGTTGVETYRVIYFNI
jgi:hypothetical protein